MQLFLERWSATFGAHSPWHDGSTLRRESPDGTVEEVQEMGMLILDGAWEAVA